MNKIEKLTDLQYKRLERIIQAGDKLVMDGKEVNEETFGNLLNLLESFLEVE